MSELPRLLIKARIARGLSQKSLAGRLGLKEQQNQMYEASEYASASLARVRSVAEVLGRGECGSRKRISFDDSWDECRYAIPCFNFLATAGFRGMDHSPRFRASFLLPVYQTNLLWTSKMQVLHTSSAVCRSLRLLALDRN